MITWFNVFLIDGCASIVLIDIQEREIDWVRVGSFDGLETYLLQGYLVGECTYIPTTCAASFDVSWVVGG